MSQEVIKHKELVLCFKLRRKKGMWKFKRLGIAAITMMLCVNGMSFSSLASAKQISSVSIKISSDIEAGDNLPQIELSDDSSIKAEKGQVIVIVTNKDKYYATDAEWVVKNDSDEELEVGDTPKLKVTLALNDPDSYKWKGSYSSSTVHVSNGTYYKSNKSGDELEVTIKLKELKGTYGEPEDPYWKGKVAKWSSPESNSSKNYEVRLKRGSSTVKTVKTTSTSYNFAGDFNRKGTYTFEVRSISGDSSKGTKSDWVESDEIDIDETDVDSSSSSNSSSNSSNSSSYNGSSTGPGGTVNRTGTPNYGPLSPMASSWQRINGNWFFIENAITTIGWRQIDGNWFYFDQTGAMATGWRFINNKWYYFTVEDTSDQGKMYHDRWLVLGDKEYYLGSDGAMFEGWQIVNGNWYYFYPGYGHKAVNTVIDGYNVDYSGIWRQ